MPFERRSREKPSTRKAVQHWRRKERARFEPLEFYRSTPSVRSPRTERVKCELGPARSRRLKQLADEPGVRAFTADLSRFNLFATIFFAYLNRVSGRRDLSILTPTHNRPTAEFKQTIGLFIEIFPLDQVGASTAIHTYLQVLLGAHIVPEEPLSKKGFVDWGSHALEKCGGLS